MKYICVEIVLLFVNVLTRGQKSQKYTFVSCSFSLSIFFIVINCTDLKILGRMSFTKAIPQCIILKESVLVKIGKQLQR